MDGAPFDDLPGRPDWGALFSVLSRWAVAAVGVVVVLSVATESLAVAGATALAYGVYAAGGYARVYAELSRRLRPSATVEAVVRPAGFVVGAVLVWAGLVALSTLTGIEALYLVRPGRNPLLSALGSGALAPLGYAVLLFGTVLVAEAAAMALRLVRLLRAPTYVGLSEPGSGTVALTGTVEPDLEGETVADGGFEFGVETVPAEEGAGTVPADDGDDGVRWEAVPAAGDADAGAADRRAESGRDGGPRPASPDGDRRTGPASAAGADAGAGVDAPGRERGGPDRPSGSASAPGTGTGGKRWRADERSPGPTGATVVATADRTGETPETTEVIEAYRPNDPVVVDVEAGDIVAVRRQCDDPTTWRKTIAHWLADAFEAEHGVDLRDDREAVRRLAAAADQVRSDLTERTRTEVILPFIGEVNGNRLHLRRQLAVVPPAADEPPRPPFGSAPGAADAGIDPATEELTDMGLSPSGVDAVFDADTDATDGDNPLGWDVRGEDASDAGDAGRDRDPYDDLLFDPRRLDLDAVFGQVGDPAADELARRRRAGSGGVDADAASAGPAGRERPADTDGPAERPRPDRSPGPDGDAGPDDRPGDGDGRETAPDREDDAGDDDGVEDADATDVRTGGVGLLESPALGEECVAYWRRRHDDGTASLGPLSTAVRGVTKADHESVPFDIRTHDGRVRVDTDDLRLVGDPDVERDDGEFGWEATVTPGDRVTVLGRVDTDEGRLRSENAVLATCDPADVQLRFMRGAAGRAALGVPAVVLGSVLAGVGPATALGASIAVGGAVGVGRILDAGARLPDLTEVRGDD